MNPFTPSVVALSSISLPKHWFSLDTRPRRLFLIISLPLCSCSCFCSCSCSCPAVLLVRTAFDLALLVWCRASGAWLLQPSARSSPPLSRRSPFLSVHTTGRAPSPIYAPRLRLHSKCPCMNLHRPPSLPFLHGQPRGMLLWVLSCSKEHPLLSSLSDFVLYFANLFWKHPPKAAPADTR
ncbi:uncharacterized protein BJ171DRAFT_234321 [Polychytrium aggregatum]|uniref:uncharacterized protein n=1 Tax=Polychytrium aggregatum TaxID=110093 RepID=UPI0022FEF393|nr:uncharacterized protein BJ171DRAFT_234321 [Polychytrium aggregatum]KAI9208098.1 hypothetical protein BJ171DRAFT_234321 [Polychytrium aggregatum]